MHYVPLQSIGIKAIINALSLHGINEYYKYTNINERLDPRTTQLYKTIDLE